VIDVFRRHRLQGAAFDTNILLAWIVGSYDSGLLGEFKRVENFDPEDFDLLQRIVAFVGTVVVTPNVMTEVANLASQMGEPRRESLFNRWASQIATYVEHYLSSAELSSRPGFARFFLTDVGLVELASRGQLILTDDTRLAGLISAHGGDALNFNHLRQIDWRLK